MAKSGCLQLSGGLHSSDRAFLPLLRRHRAPLTPRTIPSLLFERPGATLGALTSPSHPLRGTDTRLWSPRSQDEPWPCRKMVLGRCLCQGQVSENWCCLCIWNKSSYHVSSPKMPRSSLKMPRDVTGGDVPGGAQGSEPVTVLGLRTWKAH